MIGNIYFPHPPPGVVVTVDGGSAPPNVINLSGGTPPSAAKVTGSPGTSATGKNSGTSDGDKGGTAGASSGGAGHSSSSPSNSNGGFDAVKEKLRPKTAELLTNCRAHGKASLRSYYRPLNILENQSAFNDAGIRWN